MRVKGGVNMPSIDINQSDVLSHSSGIKGGASSIQVKSLSPQDSESTISGNVECQAAFIKSQTMLSQLMSAVQREANLIEQLGTEFQEADKCLADMVSHLSS